MFEFIIFDVPAFKCLNTARPMLYTVFLLICVLTSSQRCQTMFKPVRFLSVATCCNSWGNTLLCGWLLSSVNKGQPEEGIPKSRLKKGEYHAPNLTECTTPICFQILAPIRVHIRVYFWQGKTENTYDFLKKI